MSSRIIKHMNRKILWGLVLILVIVLIYLDQSFEPQNIEELRKIANSKAEILPPKAFTTDGCSMWPNSRFTDICIQHNIMYWKGGTSKERKIADM